MNIHEVVKNYNKLKNDMMEYVKKKYDFENDDLVLYSFDIVLDEQDQVVAKFMIEYSEPTFLKSYIMTFDEFVKETNYDRRQNNN